ncbi:MAG: magnesium/cobalt transporter CorA [Candidatus Brocadiaceae bacterium]|nr:magnesium/cobalt transporter CorA [Candidatus Brocadiaceae bacterium]
MFKHIKKRSKKAGSPPGTLIHVGEKKAETVKIYVFDYDEKHCTEKGIHRIEDCFPLKDTPTVTWINISGLHQIDIIEQAGKHFGLHSLLLEDILNTDQRPKIEDFGKYLFIVIRMLFYNNGKNEIESEQMSFIIGPQYVISFQEKEGDIFDSVRERIRNGKGKIRKGSTDYLVYTLIDAIVDHYFIILEKTGEKIDKLEENLLTNPMPEALQTIHTIKREMIFMRRSVWPLREVIRIFERAESPLIKETTVIYLRDVYDHTIQIIDTIETFRDIVSGMLDIYLSSISNKMNEVMKMLTIIATIFIPLTFIAGVYGMNFKYLPELEWKWGYFAILSVMGIVGVSMIAYFKRKKWL